MALTKSNLNVKFIKITEAQYQALVATNNVVEGAIYFTEAGCIYIDGVAYGVGAEKTVKDVSIYTITAADHAADNSLVEGEKVLKVSYGDSETAEYIHAADLVDMLPEATDSSAGLMSAADKAALDALASAEPAESVYVPNSALADVASTSHGGLVSKTGAQFTADRMTFSQMFDAILFPTVNPTITQPSITSYSVSPSLVEVGETIPAEGTYSFSRGNVKLGTTTVASNYSGAETSHSVAVTDGLTPGADVMPAKTLTYNLTVNYSAGTYQPVTNKGENYSSVCAAGSKTKTATVNAAYAYFATTNAADSSALIKQSLIANAGISSVTTPEFTLAPHSSASHSKIKLPNRTLTSMQMYNTVAKVFETVSFSSWSHSTEEENGITYHVYEYTGEDRGSVKLIISF